eukprot:GFYU01016593.1.p1 GENE.GFYU01016593.1~~GFYU01016593.1.p1  ORF type:complete len:265 (-),score=75.49 GFYU01016593.1:230-925(-)
MPHFPPHAHTGASGPKVAWGPQDAPPPAMRSEDYGESQRKDKELERLTNELQNGRNELKAAKAESAVVLQEKTRLTQVNETLQVQVKELSTKVSESNVDTLLARIEQLEQKHRSRVAGSANSLPLFERELIQHQLIVERLQQETARAKEECRAEVAKMKQKTAEVIQRKNAENQQFREQLDMLLGQLSVYETSDQVIASNPNVQHYTLPTADAVTHSNRGPRLSPDTSLVA